VDRHRLVDPLERLVGLPPIGQLPDRALTRAEPQPVDREPSGQLGQPGPDRGRVAKLVEPLEGASEDLLEDLLGVGFAKLEGRRRDREDVAGEALDELAPGPLVAAAAAGDELRIRQDGDRPTLDQSPAPCADRRPVRRESTSMTLRRQTADAIRALLDVFRTPDLRRLGFAYLTSLVAHWAYGVVISVYAFEVGGAALVGIAAVARLAPAAVAAPFVAGLADRYPRRLVLLVSDLGRAALIAVAAAAIAGGAPAAVVFAIASANAIVGTAFEPAKSALLPSLAASPRQLTAANTAMSTFESASFFIGPALGGIALAVSTIQVALALVGVLLVLSVLQVARIGAAGDEERGGGEGEGQLAEALAGFRALRDDRRLRTMVGLVGAQVLVDGALAVMIIAMSIDLLGAGEAGVGYLNSAVGIGGLVGAVVTLALTGRRGLGSVFAIGLFAWGAPLILVGVAPTIATAAACLVVVGVANTVVDASFLTLLQRSTPAAILGRVFGVMESLVVGATALGSLIAPALIGAIGIRGALIASGALLPALALIARPQLRRIDAAAPPPTRRLELLRAIPMFAPLGPVPLEELAGSLEPARFAAGDSILRQGEPGDRFYVIETGEVEVVEDGRLVRSEGPGEHFGEIALLRDVPRTATVRARSDVGLLTLGRDDFLAAVTGEGASYEAAEAVVATRLGATRR
jgi:MFS family permease